MPSVPKEIELKLTVTPADFGALKVHSTFAELLSNPVRTETLNSIYFDTDQFDLHDRGVSLRVRRNGEKFVQTIKFTPSSGRTLERAEWEQPLENGEPDLDAAANTALAPLLTPHVRAALRPIFETRIHRSYFHLADNAWQIEIAFDQGEIVAGNHVLPVCEIELELKYGYRAALFELARMIVEVVPVQLALASKSERAYHLIQDKPRQFFSAEDIALVPGTTTAQAFQTITCDCLRQLIANAPLMHRRNPEALHQMRIALRRLRTAISVFSEIVRDGQVDRIKAELKWLNGELSPARDLDVLLDEVMKPQIRQHPDHRGLKSLYCSFARQRLRSYQRAEKTVRSQRFCKLLIETFAWIEIGEWVTATDEPTHQHREWPIEHFAADQLSWRRRKIMKKSKNLDELDPAQRHRLRIQVKKARYAMEFFASLFQDKKSARRSARLLTALKRLQNSLGGLNDVITRKLLCTDILSRQARSLNGTAGRDRAFAAGLITGSQEARCDELLSDALKAYAQLKDTKPFWK
jgi:inorganic triphosphatase YgiF